MLNKYKITFGKWLKEYRAEYPLAQDCIDNMKVEQKLDWYLDSLKELQKHINKEIKQVKQCLGK